MLTFDVVDDASTDHNLDVDVSTDSTERKSYRGNPWLGYLKPWKIIPVQIEPQTFYSQTWRFKHPDAQLMVVVRFT